VTTTGGGGGVGGVGVGGGVTAIVTGVFSCPANTVTWNTHTEVTLKVFTVAVTLLAPAGTVTIA